MPQFQLVREAARAFGLPVIDVEGFEADDLIAAYAKRAKAAGEPVVVVSSDKDLMQLVADGVELWDPMKQKHIGRDEVIEKFGVGPELVCDALALIGDTSDNVPGVPGIGPKGAAQLLHRVRLARGPAGQSRPDQAAEAARGAGQHAEQARLSYRLVCLDARRAAAAGARRAAPAAVRPHRAAPVPAGERLPSLSAPDRGPDGRPRPPARREQATAERRLAAVTTLAELDAILARAVDVGVLALDTETTSLDLSRAKLVGVCLAVAEGEGFYVPLAHVDEFGQRRDGQLDLPDVIERLRPVLVDPSVLKIGHNIKYDQGMLARYGLERHARSTTPC